jgi:hypothetical protein
MDAILLIIGIKSVQQCTYFLFSVNLLLVGVNYEPYKFAVNKRQNTNYSVTEKYYLNLSMARGPGNYFLNLKRH